MRRINEEAILVQSDVTVNADSLEDNKLKVFLRIRPSTERELISDLGFSCDYVFDGDASQLSVYQKITPDLLQSFVDGRNVCIFAYGQTGSGRLTGDKISHLRPNWEDIYGCPLKLISAIWNCILGNKADLGLLPRFVEEVLQKVSADIKEETVSIEVSFYEIYKEKVYDLLSHKKNVLKVRGAEKVYLEDLTAFPIKNWNDFKEVLMFGLSKRATSATLVNETSSRSHAIFQMKLRKNHEQMVGVEVKSFVVVSDCYFVDLAGSERLSFTQGGDRAETAAINCSLLALQKVIECKANGGSAFVNYRESVLTRLLKECFGGNSKTALLATISSGVEYRQFTLQTLRFSMNAGKVHQFPKQNVDPLFQAIQCLKAKNESMEAELKKLRRGHIEETSAEMVRCKEGRLKSEKNAVCQGYQQIPSVALVPHISDQSALKIAELEQRIESYKNLVVHKDQAIEQYERSLTYKSNRVDILRTFLEDTQSNQKKIEMEYEQLKNHPKKSCTKKRS
uniref:Kinesin motor domain-containing protein n=1 Tax=Ditylenchus dipsaci TaxID=166011 RepID=A0A915DZI9_9BILA